MCEVASNSKKVKPFKMFNLYSSMNRRGADDNDQPKELETTGHDRFCQIRHSRYIRNSRPQLHFLCSPFVFFPSVFLALARFYYFFFFVVYSYLLLMVAMLIWHVLFSLPRFHTSDHHFARSTKRLCDVLNRPLNSISKH